jgi:hypothetical protein
VEFVYPELKSQDILGQGRVVVRLKVVLGCQRAFALRVDLKDPASYFSRRFRGGMMG